MPKEVKRKHSRSTPAAKTPAKIRSASADKGGVATATSPAMAGDAPTMPVIEYPGEGDTIMSSDYTFRVSVPFAPTRVEVSMNGERWLDCREAVGLWWFDWQDYVPGAYEAVVRATKEDGTTVQTAPRRFSVQF